MFYLRTKKWVRVKAPSLYSNTLIDQGICNFLLVKNKKPKRKRSCPRGETETTYEENNERRKKKCSERRQDIFLKLKELNVTVRNQMYLELYKKK